MNEKIKMIHDWLDAHKDEMVSDHMKLVTFPSVSDSKSDIKPFGQPCIDVLTHMLKRGEEVGFATHNYENYVGHITANASKSAEETIGLWAHLDVVPAGDGWHTEPYEPVIVNNCIIGRGAKDNKDAAMGSFYIMRAIKELGIELNHNLTLYLGTSEETGMHDVQYYLDKGYPLPKLSLVPDAGWPGVRGQYGRIEFNLISDEPVSSDIIELSAGYATNIIPNEAIIVLSKNIGFDISKVPAERYEVEETEDTIKITAIGKSGHAAFPQNGSINAVYLLTKLVAENGCLNEHDQKLFDFITAVNADYYGTALGIAGSDENGQTISSATMLSLEDGRMIVRNDCRFCVSGVFEELVASLTEKAATCGMKPEVLSFMTGSARSEDSVEVQVVKTAYKEATGEDATLVVSRGGTYAGKLPRSLAVGMYSSDRSSFPEYIGEGHGGPHQPDEALPIDGFLDGVKLFATVLLRMDDAIK